VQVLADVAVDRVLTVREPEPEPQNGAPEDGR
jgi:hypothetical protein